MWWELQGQPSCPAVSVCPSTHKYLPAASFAGSLRAPSELLGAWLTPLVLCSLGRLTSPSGDLCLLMGLLGAWSFVLEPGAEMWSHL